MRTRRRIILPVAFLSLTLAAAGTSAGCLLLHANPPPPWVAGATGHSSDMGILETDWPSSVLPADPQAAFVALEQRLLAATSIDIAVEVESGAPYVSLLTGTLALGSANQLTLSIDGQFKGEPVHLRLRSNAGRLVGGPHGDGDATVDLPTPAKLTEAVIVGMLGMGLLHNLALISFGMPPDHAAGGAAQWVVTSAHTWDTGRDATIGGAAGRALSFEISVEGHAVGDATLWLDAATGLPLKREVNVHFSGEGEGGASGTMHVSETYLKFEVKP
jgi:hypothetical protein